MIGNEIEQPKGRFALTNGRVILPQEIVTSKEIVVEGKKIVGIADADSLGAETSRQA